MTIPTISVIIPMYNTERFIGEAIRSVRDQGVDDVEIIVVDDGSTDDGAARVQTIGGNDIRCVYQANSGPSAARNRGIQEARADVIALLDADDLFPMGKLRAQLDTLNGEPELDIVNGYVQLISMPGAEANNPHAPHRIRNIPSPDFNLGAALYRRAIFDRVGLFDESMPVSEDVDWWLRAEDAGLKMRILRRVTLFYRRHQANMTLTSSLSQIHNFSMLALRHAEARRGQPVDLRMRSWNGFMEPPPQVFPSLSVIVITPPEADTLARLLANLTEQAYPIDEIVIVSDGACEPLEALAAATPNTRLIRAAGEGTIAARNTGLAAAIGEWVAFLDHEHRWFPHKLAHQAHILRDNPQIDFVSSGVVLQVNNLQARSDVFAQWSADASWFSLTNGMLARRSLFTRIGAFAPQYPLVSDREWFIRALDANIPWMMTQDIYTEHQLTDEVVMNQRYERMRREMIHAHHASIKRRRQEAR